MDGEAGASRGRPDQLDDHRMGEQRLAAPVLRNEGEEAMFNPVPFAGAGRVVGERDRQPGLIGEALQLALPEANAGAVAAAAIRGDQEPGGGAIALPAEGEPPTPDAQPAPAQAGGESGGIVVDPDPGLRRGRLLTQPVFAAMS